MSEASVDSLVQRFIEEDLDRLNKRRELLGLDDECDFQIEVDGFNEELNRISELTKVVLANINNFTDIDPYSTCVSDTELQFNERTESERTAHLDELEAHLDAVINSLSQPNDDISDEDIYQAIENLEKVNLIDEDHKSTIDERNRTVKKYLLIAQAPIVMPIAYYLISFAPNSPTALSIFALVNLLSSFGLAGIFTNVSLKEALDSLKRFLEIILSNNRGGNPSKVLKLGQSYPFQGHTYREITSHQYGYQQEQDRLLGDFSRRLQEELEKDMRDLSPEEDDRLQSLQEEVTLESVSSVKASF